MSITISQAQENVKNAKLEVGKAKRVLKELVKADLEKRNTNTVYDLAVTCINELLTDSETKILSSSVQLKSAESDDTYRVTITVQKK